MHAPRYIYASATSRRQLRRRRPRRRDAWLPISVATAVIAAALVGAELLRSLA